MTESTMRFDGRLVSIHCSPEGLDRVAALLVELARLMERIQAKQPVAVSEPVRE